MQMLCQASGKRYKEERLDVFASCSHGRIYGLNAVGVYEFMLTPDSGVFKNGLSAE